MLFFQNKMCAQKNLCFFKSARFFYVWSIFLKKCVREKKHALHFFQCFFGIAAQIKVPIINVRTIFFTVEKKVCMFFFAHVFFSCMVFFRVFVKTKKIRRFQEKNIKDDIRPSPHSAIQNGRKWAKPKIGTVS